MAAVGISVIDFYQLGRERQLLAIAYLLIYLQIVLMYQQKDVRVYWQLFMLSLLQVVVASALNFGVLFGVLLVGYMFAALFALTVFFFYRETSRLAGTEPNPLAVPVPRHGGALESNPGPRAHVQPPIEFLRRRIAWRTLGEGSATLVFTLLCFFLLPRLGDEPMLRRVTAGRMVGFTETVQLGALGADVQNPQSVMRVWFSDPQTGQNYRIHGSPRFRGTVLNRYEDGSWSLTFTQPLYREVKRLEMLGPGKVRPVHQRISIEPLRQSTVCAVYPAYAISQDDPFAYDVSKQQIVRLGSNRAKMELLLGTKGLQRGLQMDITPVHGELELTTVQDFLQLPGPADDGSDPLEGLKKLADRVVRDSGVPESDAIGRARALERFLRDSGTFHYSLEGQDRDPVLDPVEDFLVNNPYGHCEYFASALALMLRSQGIPARIVIGFRGGEWNSLGSYYQVRQLHAHAWVEMYLKDIPRRHAFASTIPFYRQPGWLALDPTPAADEEEDETAVGELAARIKEWMNYGEYLWSNYIVDLNAKRQREGIYEPLAGLSESIAALFTRQFWTSDVPAFFKSLVEGDGSGFLPMLRSWRGGLVVILLLLSATLAFRLRRPVLSGVRYLIRSSPVALRQPPGTSVAFYRRLEMLLKKHGMTRPAGQTQREFAVAVGGQLAENPVHAKASAVPKQIAEHFYRVRYGGVVLDKHDAERLERSLHQLAGALKNRT
jgi:transglutaminase-like putative cysteine protease